MTSSPSRRSATRRRFAHATAPALNPRKAASDAIDRARVAAAEIMAAVLANAPQEMILAFNRMIDSDGILGGFAVIDQLITVGRKYDPQMAPLPGGKPEVTEFVAVLAANSAAGRYTESFELVCGLRRRADYDCFLSCVLVDLAHRAATAWARSHADDPDCPHCRGDM